MSVDPVGWGSVCLVVVRGPYFRLQMYVGTTFSSDTARLSKRVEWCGLIGVHCIIAGLCQITKALFVEHNSTHVSSHGLSDSVSGPS